MDLILTEQQQLVEASARRLCEGLAGPRRMRAMIDDERQLDEPAWQQVVAAGWPTLLVPEAREGQGMGAFELALIAEIAGAHLLHVPLVEACAARWLVAAAPPSDLADDLLRAPELLLPCWVDPHDRYAGRSRWPELRGDTLWGDLQGPRFNASAQSLLVPATSGAEFVLAVLDTTSPGLQRQPAGDIDHVRADHLQLQDVPVGARVLARGQAARDLYRKLGELLQLGSGAMLLGLAQTAHAMTLDHLRTRRQFGKPLAAFQALQHRCVDTFIDAELNRSLLFRVAGAWDLRQHHPAMVHAVKARTSRAALAVTRMALQMHGAMGYTQQHDIGLFYRRALALAASYGNDNHHSARFSALTWATQERP